MKYNWLLIVMIASLVGMSLAFCAGLAFLLFIDRPVGLFPAQFVLGQAMTFFTIILAFAFYDYLKRRQGK